MGSGIGALGSGLMAQPSVPALGGPGAVQWSASPQVSFAPSLPSVLPADIEVAVPQQAGWVPTLAPAILAGDAKTLAAPVMAQRMSPESVAEISARVFDNKALAPVVQADLPVAPGFGGGTAPQVRTETPGLGPRVLKRAVRLIITGPPGSGKGTYAQLLSKEYGVPHISVGELLRSYAKTHPDVAAIMSQGKLVDTQLVLRVVRERLQQPDVRERGFILDGFPRRVVEARALKTMLGRRSVDAVISLSVPESELLRRILSRGRADDNSEVFKERMRIYREDTVPAAELFRRGRPVLAPSVAGPMIQTNYAALKGQFEAWAESARLK